MKNFPKGKYLIITFLVVFISTIAIVVGLSLNKEINNSNPPEMSTTTPGNKDNNLTTKTAMEIEIEEAESKSAYNKSQYQQKYLYYMSLDRFTGTQSSYNNRLYSINQEMGSVYAECMNKINKIDPSLGQGYKEQLKKQYESERDKKIRELSTEKEDLEKSWNNQQNYLRYYNLYLNEDSKLEEEIEKIKNKYK